jgi:hypothetical protein
MSQGTTTGQDQSMDGQFAAAYVTSKIDDIRQLLRSGYRVPSENILWQMRCETEAGKVDLVHHLM